MLNAQLRFIKENASLSRTEYRRFARIYKEYHLALVELNSEYAGHGMAWAAPNDSSNSYLQRWSIINETYGEDLERYLSEDARIRIGKAQWELGQVLWQRWAQEHKKMIELQMQQFQAYQQMYWKEMTEKRMEWRRNFIQGWQLPDSAVRGYGPPAWQPRP